jgi:hypothetical protein
VSSLTFPACVGISYAAHDYAERTLKATMGVNQLSFVYKFLAGSFSGAVGTITTYPLDVLRVRLALTPVRAPERF